jgi:hypothetical protein
MLGKAKGSTRRLLLLRKRKRLRIRTKQNSMKAKLKRRSAAIMTPIRAEVGRRWDVLVSPKLPEGVIELVEGKTVDTLKDLLRYCEGRYYNSVPGSLGNQSNDCVVAE